MSRPIDRRGMGRSCGTPTLAIVEGSRAGSCYCLTSDWSSMAAIWTNLAVIRKGRNQGFE
jgi:hypothetical protein